MTKGTAALTLGLALMTACGSGSGSDSNGEACPTPVPVADTSAIPSDLPLEEFGTVTKVEPGRRAVGAEAITTTSIVELYPPLGRSVLDAGYDILASENEGFEAEIFFTKGKASGAYRLREGPCRGQVTIRLLFTRGRRAGS